MSVPQDTSKNHPGSSNKEQKVIVLSMKNMPSFKFDVSKSLLASNQDNGQSVFSFKPQQLLQSTPHSIQVSQPKSSATNIQVVSQPIVSTNTSVKKLTGTAGTILIRAQSPTMSPVQKQATKPQQLSLINHPNIKIQENQNSTGLQKISPKIMMKNQAGHTVLLHNTGSSVKQVQPITTAHHKKIIVPVPGSGQNQTKIYQIPCQTQKTVQKQPIKIIHQSALKESSKPIPILPKPDTQKIVVQQQIILPSAVIVQQSGSNQQIKSNVITIPATGPSFVKYNVPQHSTAKWSMPTVSNISLPPALAPIQPKVSIAQSQVSVPAASLSVIENNKNDNLKMLIEADQIGYENSSESEVFDDDEEEEEEEEEEEFCVENIENNNLQEEIQQNITVTEKVRKFSNIDDDDDDEEEFLDVKRIIEGDEGLQMIEEAPEKVIECKESCEINSDKNNTVVTNTSTCITQNNTNSNNNNMLLCDEQIASVTPEESPESDEKSKDQVTPVHLNEENTMKSLSIENVKKNLKLDLVSTTTTNITADPKTISHDNSENENIMEIDENDDDLSNQSEQSQIQAEQSKSMSDDSPSKVLSSEQQATTSKRDHIKPKRSRKPKNPTVITSLGLPYKPSQPTNRKKKVEKKIELEMDIHDPLNKILWEDGIGGLNNCNKLFGFNEFGLIEVLNKKDATAKLKLYDDEKIPNVDDNHNFKFRKIVDPIDQFVCVTCSKFGTVRDFFSPECCSESCFAITKRKTTEFNSSGKDENIDSGLNTPTDLKMVMFEGELITLSQLHQQLLEQHLPESKRKKHGTKKRIPTGITEVKFSWDSYLSPKSVPAPKNLFLYTSKTATTYFRVGMKLEAIDPRNQQMICVCTVEEKLGCRMKLHFDGYPATYDFWTNSDSFNIFPAGFCQSTNRKLHVPPRWNNKKFDWTEYFDYTNSVGAQRYMFPRLVAPNKENPLTIGMKLEAKHGDSWYAATIFDVLNLRILIRFDGIYDQFGYFWHDIHSPYLNACNGHKSLSNPDCFKPPFEPISKPFEWREYLISTGAIEAPKNFFIQNTRKPYQFEPGMKLEIVDKVNPQLIRPATILCQDEYKIHVIFDGFDINYAYWLDDDSEDIHPINYCKETEHPIEHPAGGTKQHESNLCSMNGCRGIGNGLFTDRYFHDNQKECPYNIENYNRLIQEKENKRLDYKPSARRNKHSSNIISENIEKSRSIILQNVESATPLKYKKESQEIEQKEEIESIEDETSNDTVKASRGRPRKRKLIESTVNIIQKEEINNKENDEERSVKIQVVKHILEDYGPQLNYAFNLWTKNSKVLDKATITDEDLSDNPLKWNVDDVCTFLVKFCDEETTAKFYAQKIDGEALLMLCQKDLVNLLDIKVGPAIKIYNRILWLRQVVMTKFAEF